MAMSLGAEQKKFYEGKVNCIVEELGMRATPGAHFDFWISRVHDLEIRSWKCNLFPV